MSSDGSRAGSVCKTLPLLSRSASRSSSRRGNAKISRPVSIQSEVPQFHRTETLLSLSKRSQPRLFSPEDAEKHKAKLGLIETYRNLQSVSRKSKMKHTASAELLYFKEIQKHRLKPETAVFTRKSSATKLDLQEFGLGDDYAAAVSVAITNTPSLESLNFRNNRLRESGALSVIETLYSSSQIRYLDLSENNLGFKATEALSRIVKSGRSYIEKLSLEKALSRKDFTNLILDAVSNNKHIKELNLARNQISTGSAKPLLRLLSENVTLEVLDLHWNTIRGSAAVALFRGLAKNSTLKVLDVSWNAMGRESSLDTCKAICKMFGENTSLRHLDLSNNYLTLPECAFLSDGVKSNHTILGIHMDGNDCDMDAKGFLQPQGEKRKDIDAHMSNRMLSPSAFRSAKVSNQTCWVCGKWQAVTFVWNIEQVAWNRRLKHIANEHRLSLEPVFLHLEIDDFQPELMTKDEDGSYVTSRAVPSEGVRFFFTYRGYAQISSAYPISAPENPITKEIFYFAEYKKVLNVVLLNRTQGSDNACNLETDYPILPRPIHWVYLADPSDFPPILPEWSIKASIFKTYKYDTPVTSMQELMKQCLDFDWKNSHLSTLIRAELDQEAAKTQFSRVYKAL